MRLEASGHAASPRTALNLLACIRNNTAGIGARSFDGPCTTTPGHLALLDAPSLPEPA
jgi:hypothetical protein